MSGAPSDNILARLEGVHPTGTGWKARCPAHDDRNPSLSIREGNEGQTVLFCHAGCGTKDILQKLGMTWSDLYPVGNGVGNGRAHGNSPSYRNGHTSHTSHTSHTHQGKGNDHKPRRVATRDYEYRDADGELTAIHRRSDLPDGTKKFVWYTPKGLQENRAGLGGLPLASLPLYGLPSLLEALEAASDAPAVLVEGEKACDALRAAGFTAVSLPGGAGQHAFGTALEPLRGRSVILWPDNDPAGEGLMLRVGAALQGVASDVRLLQPEMLEKEKLGGIAFGPKDDAADYFERGGQGDLLRDRLLSAPPFQSSPVSTEPGPRAGTIGLVRLSDVQPEAVSWLWPGRVPLGKLTVLDGDPGLGKSMITLDLAARISTGRTMPDGSRSDLTAPAGVVLLTAEDGLADTIRPRLDAAGADVNRIGALQFVLEGTNERMPTLGDLHDLETAIAVYDAKLVIVDPIMAYLPAEANSYRDQDIRSILAPLSGLAESTGAAFLLVRHLNKAAGGNPLYRGGGSIGIVGAARSGLLVARDPEDESGQRRILAGTKSNLAVAPEAWAYTVEAGEAGVPYIRWHAATSHTAAGLLAASYGTDDGEGHTALSEAAEFLRDVLADGPQETSKVKGEARQAGIADRTLDRAKLRLGIKANKQGYANGSKWVWALPESEAGEVEARRTPNPPKDANQNSWRPSMDLASFADVGTDVPPSRGSVLPPELPGWAFDGKATMAS